MRLWLSSLVLLLLSAFTLSATAAPFTCAAWCAEYITKQGVYPDGHVVTWRGWEAEKNFERVFAVAPTLEGAVESLESKCLAQAKAEAKAKAALPATYTKLGRGQITVSYTGEGRSELRNPGKDDADFNPITDCVQNRD